MIGILFPPKVIYHRSVCWHCCVVLMSMYCDDLKTTGIKISNSTYNLKPNFFFSGPSMARNNLSSQAYDDSFAA